MSTSLKVQYANEIAEAMAEALGEKFEKTAALEKVAGPVLEKFKGALQAVRGDAGKVDALWNQYLDALKQEENKFPGTIEEAARAREAAKGGPGTSIPPAFDAQSAEDKPCEKCGKCPCQCMKADDVQMAICPECGQVSNPEIEKLPLKDDEPEPMAWDANTAVAADFAMKHLINVADALDGKGFTEVANLVDEALKKLASKKKVK